MEEDIKKVKEELEKTRSQLYILYELNKAMRTTLRLEEIVYIILTGLTAHEGLSFNRAILFLVDDDAKKINGFMGIGPMYMQEATSIWRSIEQQKMDLYDLIKTYHRIKEETLKPKFMEYVQSLSFDLNEASGFLYSALWERGTLHIKDTKTVELKDDSICLKLQLGEFLIASLWIKDKPEGIIIVDNYVTKKPIDEADIRIFNMFVEQATGAIENSRAYEDTLIKAHTDTLTSLWNHGYFQYKLDEELLKAKSKNYPISILMIDLDDFKKFNDAYGHIQGDEALKKVSEQLKKTAREIDIICRYGGEEFSVILPFTNKDEAFSIAELLRKNLADNNIAGYKFTVSIGLSNYPQDGQEKDVLIRKADMALYKAKREGKNKVERAF
ncbi:MAG: sensor domain-containing diguanylate cyclase [Candidatus Omnitrophica bacterium]|jgi:diguanylate cyclase (GGDEF)-like protein|nr:sensor domain-containing diguanylate cyclase [Candidatus Omnitrophota bacterium]